MPWRKQEVADALVVFGSSKCCSRRCSLTLTKDDSLTHAFIRLLASLLHPFWTVVRDFYSLTDDTIGMAVDLWSEVTVERSDKFEIVAEGDGAEQMPTDESNYMVVGCKAAFETAGKPLPTLRYHVKNRIPFARGLGSSSAGIVAGIVAGLVLAGHRLPCWGSEALLQIAAGIEGHPDNVAPAIYGGIVSWIWRF